MISGIRECTVGSYHATRDGLRICGVDRGRNVITPDGGTPVTVKAGDALVVGKDFDGTWKIEENASTSISL